MKKPLVALAIVLALLLAPALGRAESDDPIPTDEAAFLIDLIVARPIGVAAIIAGSIMYLPAAILTEWGGNDPEPVFDLLIRRPRNFTFKRPLGRFED